MCSQRISIRSSYSGERFATEIRALRLQLDNKPQAALLLRVKVQYSESPIPSNVVIPTYERIRDRVRNTSELATSWQTGASNVRVETTGEVGSVSPD